MHGKLPSLTATLVAFARASYTVAPAPYSVAKDPVAIALMPAPFALLARGMPQAWRAPHATERVLELASFGLLPHVALRTAAIDDAVRDAIGHGVRQLVILGAGLDARAYRMPELREVDVFEVDHPATQGYKHARIAGHAPSARSVHRVPVDFERDRLGTVLSRAGHDASAPTFWIWEGVTVYLRPAAIDATLGEIAARSAKGSRVAITYSPPGLIEGLGLVSRTLMRASALVVGEPVHGVMTRDEMHARLAREGFAVLSDESTDDWHARWWRASGVRPLAATERLVVAERVE